MSMKISDKIKTRIVGVRNYPKEPLEDVVKRLLDYYSQDETLTPQEIKDAQEGLNDIKNNRVYTTKQLNQKLGL